MQNVDYLYTEAYENWCKENERFNQMIFEETHGKRINFLVEMCHKAFDYIIENDYKICDKMASYQNGIYCKKKCDGTLKRECVERFLRDVYQKK